MQQPFCVDHGTLNVSLLILQNKDSEDHVFVVVDAALPISIIL